MQLSFLAAAFPNYILGNISLQIQMKGLDNSKYGSSLPVKFVFKTGCNSILIPIISVACMPSFALISFIITWNGFVSGLSVPFSPIETSEV